MFQWFGYFLLWIVNWKFEHTVVVDKAVMIGYPHTSWFDSYIIWCSSFIVNIRGVMKAETIFTKIVASLCGFIKIDRKGGLNQTDVIAKYIRNHNGNIYVSIAPEGTRKRKEYIKTGFYHIAKSSSTPIVCGMLNYKTRTLSCSEPFHVDNLSKLECVEKIRNYYDAHNAGETACYPDHVSRFETKD